LGEPHAGESGELVVGEVELLEGLERAVGVGGEGEASVVEFVVGLVGGLEGVDEVGAEVERFELGERREVVQVG